MYFIYIQNFLLYIQIPFKNLTYLFYRKYFDNMYLLNDRKQIYSLTPPHKYPGSDLSFDDQCKLISPDYVHYSWVRND